MTDEVKGADVAPFEEALANKFGWKKIVRGVVGRLKERIFGSPPESGKEPEVQESLPATLSPQPSPEETQTVPPDIASATGEHATLAGGDEEKKVPASEGEVSSPVEAVSALPSVDPMNTEAAAPVPSTETASPLQTPEAPTGTTGDPTPAAEQPTQPEKSLFQRLFGLGKK
jgi:hypothetical protein